MVNAQCANVLIWVKEALYFSLPIVLSESRQWQWWNPKYCLSYLIIIISVKHMNTTLMEVLPFLTRAANPSILLYSDLMLPIKIEWTLYCIFSSDVWTQLSSFVLPLRVLLISAGDVNCSGHHAGLASVPWAGPWCKYVQTKFMMKKIQTITVCNSMFRVAQFNITSKIRCEEVKNKKIRRSFCSHLHANLG